MVNRDMNVFHDIDEANLALDQANEEIKRLIKTFQKIYDYYPHMPGNETRETYTKRVLQEIRDIASKELTGEAYWTATNEL